MSETVKVSIPADDEGFVTFQCPFCSEHFKLDAGEVQEDSVFDIFCPLCGLKDKATAFLSDDVIEHMQQIAINTMNGMLNDWTKGLEKQFRGNKGMTFKAGKPLPQEEPKLLFEKENDMDIVNFDCCNRKAKVKNSNVQVKVYCPYCGVK